MKNHPADAFANATGRILGIIFLCCVGTLIAHAQVMKAGAVPPWADGLPNAPVTLEVYFDYQCPPCATFYPDLKKVIAAFPQDLQVIYRNMPLTRIHPLALPAARAAEAAGMQGQFYAMKELLLTKQAKWTSSKDSAETFGIYAKSLGLDVPQFRLDMKSEGVAERIKSDQERALEIGVTGTPTVFLNGKAVRFEDTNFSRLTVLINQALKPSMPEQTSNSELRVR